MKTGAIIVIEQLKKEKIILGGNTNVWLQTQDFFRIDIQFWRLSLCIKFGYSEMDVKDMSKVS